LGLGKNENFLLLMKKSRLTRDKGYEIQTCLKMGVKPAEIARQLGKNRSVISREIKRNSAQTCLSSMSSVRR